MTDFNPTLFHDRSSELSADERSVLNAGQGRSLRKVLFFYQDFGQMGGIERYLLQVGQALTASGLFQPVFVCSARTPLYHRLRQAGFAVYGLKGLALFSGSFWRSLDVLSLGQLWRIVRREQPDIVHVHIGLLETLLPQAWGYPVVFTFHGYGSLYSESWAGHAVGAHAGANANTVLKRLFKRCVAALFRFTAVRLEALLLVSAAEQERLVNERFLPSAHRGQVVHNGVPIQALQTASQIADASALRQALGLSPSHRVISFINRLEGNKNPADFLALAGRFAEDASTADCVFLLVGDGPLKQQMAQLAAPLPNVRLVGYREDVPALLALTDVLAYPALREGFGLGLVEAMACGVPCVAYASEGAGEILATPTTQDCLVPVGDVDALDAQVRQFLGLSDPEKEAIKAALRKRSQDFDLSASMQQLCRVYEHLAPQVSVILPVYNGARCVLQAVRSVLNQRYPHWELIVVDDGSSDDTLAVLATIEDSRIRVLTQQNQGVAASRNNAFKVAKGEYIAFIDADDVWLPHKLSEEIRVIRQKTRADSLACIVYSGYYAVDEANRLVNLPKVRQVQGDLSEMALADEGLFLPSTSMVHRSVFEAVGGFQTRCYHEDRVFFVQACQRFPVYATGQRLVLYRQSEAGRCRSVLKDYDQALAAELSIVETLSDTIADAPLGLLSLQQRRNLVCRFLMYGYLDSARRLYQAMGKEQSSPQQQAAMGACFKGRKGQLTLLSLRTGVNVLWVARFCLQMLMRCVPLSLLMPCSLLIPSFLLSLFSLVQSVTPFPQTTVSKGASSC